MQNIGLDARDVYDILEKFFRPHECTDIFDRLGVQYHNTDHITKVYTSTFASKEAIDQVLARKESDVMLFSHHPVPPRSNENQPYPEIPQYLVQRLREARVSLFSYHIPLDRHNPYAPSYTLALAMGLQSYDTFYTQNGVTMGELCQSYYTDVYELASRMEHVLGHDVRLCGYGDTALENGRVAVMAGCAKNPEVYVSLREQGVNTLITGVTSQDIIWVPAVHEQAKANCVNILGGTHYSTEKFAPIALVQYFEDLGIPCEFVEESPNMSDL